MFWEVTIILMSDMISDLTITTIIKIMILTIMMTILALLISSDTESTHINLFLSKMETKLCRIAEKPNVTL